MTQITTTVTHILEYEIKWALGSINMNIASGDDGLLAELFQTLKDDAVKSSVLHMPANLENSAVAKGPEKVGLHSHPKGRQCQRVFKLAHNGIHHTLAK